MFAGGWRSAAAFVLCGVCLSSAAAEPVVLGVLGHRGDTVARAKWEPTARYLAAGLKRDVRLRPLTLEGVAAALAGDQLDFLLTNPGHYVSISARYGLSPVATLRRHSGARGALNQYGAVLFTRADRRDINALGDLKGRSFAAVSPDAFGGYQLAAHTMLRNGLDPRRDLGSLNFLGFPQDRIVAAVLDGQADAGTVRTGIIEALVAEGRLGATDLKLLNVRRIDGFDLRLSTALFPEWTFAATRRAPAGLRREVAMHLLAMQDDTPAALAGGYSGWNTPANDAPVRDVLSALEDLQQPAAPPLLRRLAGWGVAAVAAGLAFLVGRRFRRRRAQSARLDSTRFTKLTRREQQVLDLIVAGLTNKEMARDLGISPKTVEFHRGHLMRKLGAESVADLVRIALAGGKSLNSQT